MMGPSHKIIGIGTGVAAAEITGLSASKMPLPYMCFIGIAVFGSLLPDADQPNSTIGKTLYVVWLPFYIIRGLISVIALIIPEYRKISKSMGHRGIAHAPEFWALICLTLFFIPWVERNYIYLIALAAGIGSHLLMDYFFGGIPLLFPFSLKRCKPVICFKSGGYAEFLIVGSCITGTVIYIGYKVLLLVGSPFL